MFSIQYRIVLYDYNKFPGEMGYISINCDKLKYGFYFPEGVEVEMLTVRLWDWFRYLTELPLLMQEDSNVAINDVESDNFWIEFERDDYDTMHMSIVQKDIRSDKFIIAKKISENKSKVLERSASCQVEQMYREIILKAEEYIEDVISLNPFLKSESQILSSEQSKLRNEISTMEQKVRCIRQITDSRNNIV